MAQQARPANRWPSGVSMNTNLTFHRSGTGPAGRRAGRVPSLPMRSIHPPRQPAIPDEGRSAKYMRTVSLFLFTSAMLAAEPAHIEYHNDFATSYSKILKAEFKFPLEIPLEKEQTIVSPLKVAVAKYQQTNPVRIPYDKEEASIVIVAPNGRHFLHVQNFKYFSLSWIDDRLLLISRGIGRIGQITEIYDTEKRVWLYQQGETYIEQARAVNRWPVGSFDERGFDVPPLRHRACWQKSRPSAFAPDVCGPPTPPASDT